MELEAFRSLADKTNTALSQFINCADDLDIKLLAHDMANDHRTLVQKKMRLCMVFIEILAANLDAGQYDLRNEHACKMAKKICDTLDRYDRMMPLI